MSPMQWVKWGLKWCRPDALQHLWVGCGVGMAMLLALLKPWPLAWLVNQLATPGSITGAALLRVMLALAVIHAGHAILQAMVQAGAIRLGLKGVQRLRDATLESVLRQEGRTPQERGDLLQRLAWDGYSVQTLYQQGVVLSLGALLNLVGMTVVMVRLHPELTAASWMVVPALWLGLRYFGKRMQDAGASAQMADAEVLGAADQVLAGRPWILADARESLAQGWFSSKVRHSFATRLTQYQWELGYGAMVGLAFALGMAWVIGLGGHWVARGELSLGALLVFVTYLTQLHEPLNLLSQAGGTTSQALAGIRRVAEVVDAPTPLAWGSHPESKGSASSAETGLRLDGVSFHYTTENQLIQNLNLEVKPGEVVVLTGPSGCGKSTLLALAGRFLEPDAGVVSWKGCPLAEWSREAFRAQVGMGFQEAWVWPGSLRENLCFGVGEAQDASLLEVLEEMGLGDWFRSLPQGLETLLGENGRALSTGERQRVQLARVLLKGAPLLLLDEPTSALDLAGEERVMQALRKRLQDQGHTALVVTHRPALLSMADRVLEMRDGGVHVQNSVTLTQG